ncbi:MAG: short-chain dehydrogenase [Rhodospirillales bacterium RIFCSPLOWO2_12_FULL_58_28]|nr:MAG: short-chain dehydrogenase [Rhodospirillales bacterium RIFCSPLOWO2_02_FULL_58_16]OHC77613.1 MAG: short-chain dehydrogenase [Rhodospirillales bacterium RIFCSPLOWO2_12_FULL_58_28]
MTENRKALRSILITGASSGIGEALAMAYAKPGVFLTISGRDEERLEAAAENCRRRGAEVVAGIIDVTERAAMLKWIKDADDRHPLDLVIANAGTSAGSGGAAGESEEQVREIFAVNLTGVLNTLLPAIALMRPRKRGQLAIMSSIAAFRGMPGAPAYSASKAAVKAYGEALRGLLAPEGVQVSVICPGFVVSRMTAENKFPMPFLMDAGKAAQKIIHGLESDRPLIAFPWPMYMVMRIIGVLPARMADRLLNRMPKKA